MTNAIKKQGQPCFFICRCWQCAVTQNATVQTYVCNVGNKTVPFAVLYSLPSTVTKRQFLEALSSSSSSISLLAKPLPNTSLTFST